MCNWNPMGKFFDLIALSLVSLVLEITGPRDIMLRVLSLLTQFLMSSGKRLRTVTAYKLQAEEVKGLEVNSNARERKVDEEAWVEQIPTNMRELLEIGLLQGLQVFYNFVHKESTNFLRHLISADRVQANGLKFLFASLIFGMNLDLARPNGMIYFRQW